MCVNNKYSILTFYIIKILNLYKLFNVNYFTYDLKYYFFYTFI